MRLLNDLDPWYLFSSRVTPENQTSSSKAENFKIATEDSVGVFCFVWGGEFRGSKKPAVTANERINLLGATVDRKDRFAATDGLLYKISFRKIMAWSKTKLVLEKQQRNHK